MRSVENGERLGAAIKLPPLVVGASDMANQDGLPRRSTKRDGDVRRHQAGRVTSWSALRKSYLSDERLPRRGSFLILRQRTMEVLFLNLKTNLLPRDLIKRVCS
jgi:hypothetical protein